MNFFREAELSQAASELIQFDAQSIQQVASGGHLNYPDVWLVDPVAYESNGRVSRDSESPRMLAYSIGDRVLYATDGCNSCLRKMPADLGRLSTEELKMFAQANDLRPELLEKLASLISGL
jgi:hypothetical protein